MAILQTQSTLTIQIRSEYDKDKILEDETVRVQAVDAANKALQLLVEEINNTDQLRLAITIPPEWSPI